MEAALLLSPGKLSQPWVRLSGGECQRCAIAVALLLARCCDGAAECGCDGDSSRDATAVFSAGTEVVMGARQQISAVVLLDEPTAACDAESCAAVERALVGSGVAAVIVTHDDAQAFRLAHRRLLLLPFTGASGKSSS